MTSSINPPLWMEKQFWSNSVRTTNVALRGKVAGYNFSARPSAPVASPASFRSVFRVSSDFTLEVGARSLARSSLARLIITITLLLGSELRVKKLSEKRADASGGCSCRKVKMNKKSALRACVLRRRIRERFPTLESFPSRLFASLPCQILTAVHMPPLVNFFVRGSKSKHPDLTHTAHARAGG